MPSEREARAGAAVWERGWEQADALMPELLELIEGLWAGHEWGRALIEETAELVVELPDSPVRWRTKSASSGTVAAS